MIQKIRDEAGKVADMAQIYGGAFDNNLSQLIRVADDDNLVKIFKTWPDIWNKYLGFWMIDNKQL